MMGRSGVNRTTARLVGSVLIIRQPGGGARHRPIMADVPRVHSHYGLHAASPCDRMAVHKLED